MQRRQFLWAGLGLPAAGARPTPAGLQWRERVFLGLGTTLHLRAAHEDGAHAEAALDAAVRAIRGVEASMSLFRADSELARLNRDGFLDAPSADLLTVLRVAQTVAQKSAGRFDPTVQPWWVLYAQAQGEGRTPSARERAALRGRIGWQHLALSPARIELRRSGMALTLNGIAQGYAADAARQTLQHHGVAHALVDAGELACLGRNPQGRAWTLGVADPRDEQRLLAVLRCDGRAVATSSDHRSAFSEDFRHHHIFDPSSGVSPAGLSSVTVLARSATLADALTKVMFVAGPGRIARLARQWGVDVLWVDKAGRWRATAGVRLAGTHIAPAAPSSF